MKSYNVKSNAKRFARGIAAKWPGQLEAVEPMAAGEPGEWFPAVELVVNWTEEAKLVLRSYAGATTIIHGMPAVDPAILAEGDAGVYAVPAEDMSELADAEAEHGNLAPTGLWYRIGEDGLPPLAKDIADASGAVVAKVASYPSADSDDAPSVFYAIVGEWEGQERASFNHAMADAAAHLQNDPETSHGNDVTDMVGTFPNTGAAAVEAAEETMQDAYGLGERSAKLFGKPGDTNPHGDPDRREEIRTRPVPGKDEPSRPQIEVVRTTGEPIKPGILSGGLTGALAALASAPATKSTPKEIAARRAERRQRIEAGEYAAKEEAPKAKKETRADIIMRMVQLPEGSAAEDIATACGWQAHTLRGYIGGTLRKRLKVVGKTIAAVKQSGEPTRYKLTDLPDEPSAA